LQGELIVIAVGLVVRSPSVVFIFGVHEQYHHAARECVREFELAGSAAGICGAHNSSMWGRFISGIIYFVIFPCGDLFRPGGSLSHVYGQARVTVFGQP